MISITFQERNKVKPKDTALVDIHKHIISENWVIYSYLAEREAEELFQISKL